MTAAAASETDPPGQKRTYTYDANDNRESETDPLGSATSYTYNGRNQVLTATDPLGPRDVKYVRRERKPDVDQVMAPGTPPPTSTTPRG